MPRKNPRPAAKKARARKRVKIAAPKPKRVGVIAHHHLSGSALATIVALMSLGRLK